ncbi:hypothetical protein BT69DRAFT_1276322 [Atractiella rhizophila]|nr:hypothetical protein BT69DRAFT_1276322 [Atractiella rhizophila]
MDNGFSRSPVFAVANIPQPFWLHFTYDPYHRQLRVSAKETAPEPLTIPLKEIVQELHLTVQVPSKPCTQIAAQLVDRVWVQSKPDGQIDYRNGCMLQWTTFPPTSPISNLPTELLYDIFSFIPLYTGSDAAESLRACGMACVFWREMVLSRYFEPRKWENKREMFRRFPRAAAHWTSLRISDEGDTFRDTRTSDLISAMARMTSLQLSGWFSGASSQILTSVLKLRNLTWIDLTNCLSDFVFSFLSYTESHQVIKEVVVAKVIPSNCGVPRPRPFNSLQRLFLRQVKDRYPFVKDLIHQEKVEKLIVANCWPFIDFDSFSQEPSIKRVELLHLTLLPAIDEEKTFEHFGAYKMIRPLDISQLKSLTDLTLDGGEEAAGLLPTNFFSSFLETGTDLKLSYLSLNYCSLSFENFVNFLDWMFRAKSSPRTVTLTLLFGEWSEEELERVRRYTRNSEWQESHSLELFESGSTVARKNRSLW